MRHKIYFENQKRALLPMKRGKTLEICGKWEISSFRADIFSFKRRVDRVTGITHFWSQRKDQVIILQINLNVEVCE